MAEENGALGRDAPPTEAEARAEVPADSESTPENPTEQGPGESAERPSGPDAAAIAELEDRWRRALADLDNARKRHARELSQAAAAERRRVCLAWLPVVDHLELALDHADADSPFVAGVRAVREAVGVLASLGFARDDETGAERLFVGVRTVETYINAVFTKLGLHAAPDGHRRVKAVLAYLDALG